MRTLVHNPFVRIAHKSIVYLLVFCLVNMPVWALNANDASVSAGTASVTNSAANTVSVDLLSNRAILDWSQMNATKIETLNFNGTSGFAVLNRVASAVNFNGTLNGAGGNIFVVSPHGILIGPDASITAGSFTASTLNISNMDFMDGVYRFSGDGIGEVANFGNISADQVALIGKKILNAGTISSPGGYTILAAGDSVYLNPEGSDVMIEVSGVTVPDTSSVEGLGDVINEGTIEAVDGGIIMATGDTFSRAIEGIDTLNVAVESGTGRVGQFGTLNANGSDGKGGNITLTAADAVVLGENSVITANAGINGDGGEIVVYSPNMALFRNGALVEAKGGLDSGNGGFFEISGKQYVETLGNINLTGARDGTFLLDPLDLWVVDLDVDAIDVIQDPDGTWKPINDATVSQLDVDILESYLDVADVTLATFGTDGSQDGDIIFDIGRALLSGTEGLSDNSLYVRAYDDIAFMEGSWINFEGNGDVELYAGVDWDALEGSGTGSVTSVDRGHTNRTIWTRKGDVIIEASAGGIDLGTLQAGVETTGNGDSTSDTVFIPGEVRLVTTEGGDITLEHMRVEGQRYGSVYVKSSGNLIINGDNNFGGAVQVKTNTTSDNEDSFSFICLIADKDIYIDGDVQAFSKGTRQSVASVWIGAGTNVSDPDNGYAGTVTINDKVLADASASGAVTSDATVRIYGSQITLPTNKAKYPEAKTQGSISVRSDTSEVKESSDTVYYQVDEDGRVVRDENGDPVIVENPEPLVEQKLGSGYRAVVEVDTTKDGTCLVCANRIRVLFPIANPDQWMQSKNLNVNITVDYVLGNDDDGLGGDLLDGILYLDTFVTANGGTLTLSEDGTQIFYMPPDDWADNFVNGEYVDTFEYSAESSEGFMTDSAIVTITLINQSPVAVDDNYSENHNVILSVDEETGVLNGALPGLEDADYDPDNDIDTILLPPAPDPLPIDEYTYTPDTLEIISYTQPEYGTVDLNTDTGEFTYTPSADNTGLEDQTFTYTISDGFGGTDTATVTIKLDNANPVAIDDNYSESHNVILSVDEETGVLNGALPGLEDADYDPDNDLANIEFTDTLEITGYTQPEYGTVDLNTDTGEFTYTPSADNTGLEDQTFTYTISDGFGGTDTATVTIKLDNANPVAIDDNYSESHNVILSVDEETGVLNGALPGLEDADYDPDNDLANIEFTDTLEITGYTQPEYGTVDLNTDTGEFTYTPSADNTGLEDQTFTYTISDGFGGTDTATVTIKLDNANPVAIDDNYSESHNVILSVDEETGVLNGALPGLEDADYDPDNDLANIEFTDTLEITGYTQPEYGTVDLNTDTGEFTYTPSADNTGLEDQTFTYTISDGFGGTDTATVTIKLDNANPVAIDDNYSESHNVILSVDEETGVLNGALPGLEDADYDPDNDLANIEFTDTLEITGYTQPEYGTVDLNTDTGEFTYTPSADNTGLEDQTFTYTISDGFGGEATAQVTIELTNQAPIAQPDNYGTEPDQTLIIEKPLDVITGVIPELNGDTDADNIVVDGWQFGDDLSAILVDGPDYGTLEFNDDGTFTYTPNGGVAGQDDSFTYYVTDSYDVSNTVTVTISIGELPPPPPDVPVAPLPLIELPELKGCPAAMDAAANELAVNSDELQLMIANSMATNPNLQPCDACENLLEAASVLKGINQESIAAMAAIFAQLAPSDAPYTPEVQAAVATAFANFRNMDEQLATMTDEQYQEYQQYAMTDEIIDAFVSYVAVLENDLKLPIGDSMALVMDKYFGSIDESGNPNIGAYLIEQIEAARAEVQ